MNELPATETANDPREHIVILGAGFAGIQLARKLKKVNVRVTLIDKNNYHTFQPLLYQVATGGLEPDSIAYPIRRVFRKQRNLTFRMAQVQKIDSTNKAVLTDRGAVPYDKLVLAVGSTTNFLKFDPEEDQLMPLKSVPEALNLRSFIMQNLERATMTTDKEERDRYTNIAIVGGGPTGVELAGALAEMKRHVIPLDFPEIDPNALNVTLIEAGPNVLLGMSDDSSKAAEKFLKDLDVDVKLNTPVESYDGETVKWDGGSLKCGTVIWAAGVKGFQIDGIGEEAVVKGDRIQVDEYARVKGHEDIYAIGDIAAMVTEENPKGFPMLAPVAIQQGKWLAKNFKKMNRGRAAEPFEFVDKGTMATVGRSKAVADLPVTTLKGAFAWLLWMFVHIMYLVGFRNRLVVFIDWAHNFFTYDRALGLIIRPYIRRIAEVKDPHVPQEPEKA